MGSNFSRNLIPSQVLFKDFVKILTAPFFSDQLSVAVSDKLSCSRRKCSKQKSALTERFVNYLRVSHNYPELMNLNMRENNLSFVSRTHWPEDVSILARTHKPEYTRMWGCEDTNKHTWTWQYEGTRIKASTQKPEDMMMQRCKQGRVLLNPPTTDQPTTNHLLTDPPTNRPPTQ